MKSKQWFLGSRIIFSFYWLLMSVVTAQAAPELSIGNYQLVESKRISRTVFEYSYKGTATNTGSDALDVSATLNIDNPGITIIKNSLSFGDVATKVDIASSDTFTIRQDRSFSFSTDELQWNIQATTPPEPEPIVLNELAPTIATTGSEFLVTGTGFTTESKVLLNGAAIPTTYVSDTILKAIVPFTADELGMLLPYPAGNFAVEVNGSNSLILEVSELPENHLPRGQILNEIAETLAIDFRQSSSDFHKILPQLLTDADDNAELKAFINTLSELIDHIDSTLLNELPQSINELDNQTMDTLERALLAKRQTLPAANSLGGMSQSAGPVALGLVTATASSAGFDGDQWLLKRKGNAEIANGLDTYNTILGICAGVSALLVASPAAPAAAIVLDYCSTKYTIGKVTEITITLNQSFTDGQIRELKLALKDRPDDFFDNRQITLNNFDNNEILSKQTTNANYITSAKIGINYRPDWCNIATDIASLFSLPAKKISDAIKNQVKETIGKLLCKESDRSFNEPTDFKTISPPFIVSHSRWMGLYEIPEYKPCQLVQLIDILLRSTDENRWLVSNDVPVDPPNILDIGSCYYQVDNAFLFPSESDVLAKIDFSITRYLVANGSFESRLKFWNSVGNYTEVAPSFTNDGAYSARLRVDSGHRGAVTSIYQDIRIPSVSDDVVLPPGARLKLQFFYKVEYNSNRPDENLGSYIPSTFLAYMAISEVDPFPLEGEIAIDSDFEGIANEIIRDDDVSLASAFGNLVGRADVTRFVGEIVRLSFSVIRGDNGSERVSVFIDDVHFDLCSDIAGSGLDPCNFAPEPIQ